MSKRPVRKEKFTTSSYRTSTVNNTQRVPYEQLFSQPSLASERDRTYGHDCFHWKTKVFYNGPMVSGPFDYVGINIPASPLYVTPAIEAAKAFAIQFSSQDVFGGFSLIEFLKELPKAISLFNPKSYVSSSGYGQYKWGFTPFMSDVLSIKDAIYRYVTNLNGKGSSRRVNRARVFKYAFPATFERGPFEFSGIARYNGTLTVDVSELTSVLSQLYLALDSFQFNPDIVTAWELTPYSFVVDYFVPITDLLAQFTNRGWGDYVAFADGWTSIKGDYTYYGRFLSGVGLDHFYKDSGTYGVGEYYSRTRISQSLPLQNNAHPFVVIKPASMQNVLDTAYVGGQLLPRGKIKKLK